MEYQQLFLIIITYLFNLIRRVRSLKSMIPICGDVVENNEKHQLTINLLFNMVAIIIKVHEWVVNLGEMNAET